MTTEHAISLLLLNGGLVFFVGMAVGLPFGVLRARGAEAETLDNWRISHVQNIQNGMLLVLVGVAASYLTLSPTLLAAMVYLLIIAAYTDMGAWIIRPLTGYTGLLPNPPALNIVAFGCFNATVVGQFAGIALFIYGAWASWVAIP